MVKTEPNEIYRENFDLFKLGQEKLLFFPKKLKFCPERTAINVVTGDFFSCANPTSAKANQIARFFDNVSWISIGLVFFIYVKINVK